MNSHRSFFVAALLLAFGFQVFGQEDVFGPAYELSASNAVRARLSSPALDEENGLIYAGGSDGRLYIFEVDTLEWLNDPAIRVGPGPCSTPLLGPDGIVYVGLADGTLAAVTNGPSLDNLGVKWRYRAAAAMVGSPAMDDDGVLYIGSRDNRLHAVANGRAKWTFDAKSDITTSPTIDAEGNIVIVAGGSVFSVSSSGSQNFVFRAGASVNTMPVVSEDGVIYFGSNKEFIFAIDGASGGSTNGGNNEGVVWKAPAGANVRSSPAIGAGGNLYIGTDNRRVLCIDTNGGFAWKFPSNFRTRGPVRGSVSIGGDGTIYVGTDAHTLYAIFPDGSPKWHCDSFKGQVRSSPVIDSFGTVYFTAGKNIYAVQDDFEADEAPWPQFRRDARHSAASDATASAPVITGQPASATATNGQSVAFAVVAHGGVPFTYQWNFNGEPIDPDLNPSATNATLLLTNVTALNAGIYDVVLSGEDFDDVFSDPAELVVVGPPAIVSGLTNRFALAGNEVRFDINAVASGALFYIWQTNGVLVTNTTDPFLVLTNLPVGTNTVRVEVVSGTNSIASGPVTLIIFPNTLALSTNNFVAAGNRFSAAVISNQLFTWGADLSGQLGDGNTNNRNMPTRTSSATDWLTVSAGGRGQTNPIGHTLAQRADGSLYAWGANSLGQLGLNNTNDARLPVRLGVDTNWIQVEAGADHSVGLRHDGTIWTWGGNQYGQLGAGDTNRTSVPSQVGEDSAWLEVRAGGYFTLARRADGTIWGWGRNDLFQLGNNSTSNALTPIRIGTNSDWTAISAGAGHSLGLRADGTMWLWGHRYGLSTITAGNPTNAFRAPTQIGNANNWTAIDAGYDHSLAINDAGAMFAFGANNIGQLGNGTSGNATGNTNNANTETPTQIGGGREWTAIAAGVKHSLARATDGTIWAWGWNIAGQIGDGTGGVAGENPEAFNRKIPVQLTFTNFASANTNSEIGPPVFTQNPSNKTAQVNGSVTFTATVTGAPLTGVLWYFNTNTPIGGSTNLSYTISLVNEGNAGSYHVVVTNISGVATSALAILTVTTNPGLPNPVPPRVGTMTKESASTLAPALIPARPTTNGTSMLVINAPPDQTLVLEFKNHLSDSQWTPIATNQVGNSNFSIADPNAAGTSRFYRVRVQ